MVAKTPTTAPPFATAADLHERLGFVPLHRIRMDPPPGTATIADVIRILDGDDKRVVELIDGVLVEKANTSLASVLGGVVGMHLGNFAESHDLGLVGGANFPVRLRGGGIRLPDVCFVPWDEIPDPLPDEPIWSGVPALAVEVLSPSNTAAEIDRKIAELFELGTKLIWVIDPPTESAVVSTRGKKPKRVGPGDVLEGGKVLPGFRLPLSDLFAAVMRKNEVGAACRSALALL